MSGERRFTLQEANALLPAVVPLLETLRAAHAIMEELQDEVMQSVPTNGGGEAHRAFLDASRSVAAAMEALTDAGIVVRDPQSGLIDFPSTRDGQDVFLCWRLGEDAVAWWHPIDTGFAGRRPL